MRPLRNRPYMSARSACSLRTAAWRGGCRGRGDPAREDSCHSPGGGRGPGLTTHHAALARGSASQAAARVSDFGVSRESVQLVLDALDILRGKYNPRVRLTISGLDNWPASASPPDGVTFRAPLPRRRSWHSSIPMTSSWFRRVSAAMAYPRRFPVVSLCSRRASEMSEAITPGSLAPHRRRERTRTGRRYRVGPSE